MPFCVGVCVRVCMCVGCVCGGVLCVCACVGWKLCCECWIKSRGKFLFLHKQLKIWAKMHKNLCCENIIWKRDLIPRVNLLIVCGFSFLLSFFSPFPRSWELFIKKEVKNGGHPELAAAAILSVFNTALLSQYGLQQPKSHTPVQRLLCRGGKIHHAGVLRGWFPPLCDFREPQWALPSWSWRNRTGLGWWTVIV